MELNRKKYSYILRIIDKKYYDDIINGHFKFGKPANWIKVGDGINDIFEGALNVKVSYNKDYFIPGESRCISDILRKRFGMYFIHYDMRIFSIPTLCFYGIESKDIDAIIPDEYFEDFTGEKRDDYFFIVLNANEFNNEMTCSLKRLGFNDEDLFFHSINYKNKCNFITMDKFPYELIYKDMNYEHQNEVRFFITNNKVEAYNKLVNDCNYFVNIDMNRIQHACFKVPKKGESIRLIHTKKRLIIKTLK